MAEKSYDTNMTNEQMARELANCGKRCDNQCNVCGRYGIYATALEVADWKDKQIRPNDEEVRALEWTIVHLKGRLRIFSKANAEAVACLENVLAKLKKARS